MKNEELKIIAQAIMNEVEGYEFYRMAASQDGTKESKEAFMELANEELQHAEYLQALFEKIKEDDEDERKLAFEVSPPSPEIYDWKKLDHQYASLAMTVFGIGIQMEKASIQFYKDAMEKTNLEEAKKLFEILIKWEEVHLDQFTKQYEIYRDGWWAEQNFAPF